MGFNYFTDIRNFRHVIAGGCKSIRDGNTCHSSRTMFGVGCDVLLDPFPIAHWLLVGGFDLFAVCAVTAFTPVSADEM